MTKNIQVSAAIIIIGNEILSGRTKDINTSTIATWLNQLGVRVQEVRVIPDVEAIIVGIINKLRKKYRCRILIRYPKNLFIQKYLSQSLNKIKIASGIKLEVDVDPINFS